MATISFNAKEDAGTLQIRAVFRQGDSRKNKSIGFTVPATKVNGKYKFWDQAKRRVKSHADADTINEKIRSWESKFDKYISKCKGQDFAPSLEDILSIYIVSGKQEKQAALVTGKPVELTLQGLYEIYLKEKKSEYKNGTYRHYKVIQQDVIAFEEYRAKLHRKTSNEPCQKITVSQVGRKIYKEFAEYLAAEEGNFNSTINIKLKKLSAVLNHGFEEGMHTSIEYKRKYKLDELDANKFPLYPEEKAKLYKYVPKTKTESEVLDAFLFATETGLRFSDVDQLGPAHLKHMSTPEGKINYIDLHEVKTEERTQLPVSDDAMKILNKYKMRKDRFFQLPTDVETNRTLKDIAGWCRLNRVCEVKQIQLKKTVVQQLPLYELISFHFARYTYITELLGKGVSPVYVQENVGHSKLETTLKYNRTQDLSRWKETLKVQNAKAS